MEQATSYHIRKKRGYEHIVFNLDKKRIQTCAPLTVDELKAVYQQCKELGWLSIWNPGAFKKCGDKR